MKKHYFLFLILLVAISCKTTQPVTPPVTETVTPPPPAQITIFKADPAEIIKGHSTVLTWKTEYVTNEKIYIDGYGDVTASEGTVTVSPTENKEYALRIIKEGTIISEKRTTVNVVEEKVPVGYSKGSDDGRFTIGGNGVRLMYGWPVPQSTSHFVIKIDNNFVSNNPNFRQNNVTYISGNEITRGEKGSVRKEITFYYDGVKIVQKLLPTTAALDTVPLNTSGQYYKIIYEITNTTDKTRNIGLASLVDLMIDDNDAAFVEVNKNKVEIESEYKGNNIPENILAYKIYGNIDLASNTILQNKKVTTPDIVYLGKWPYLHSVLWDVQTNGQTFGDNALLLKWLESPLAKGETRTISYAYGLPSIGQVSVLSNKKFEEKTCTVFFSYNDMLLTKKNIKTIDDIIKSSQNKIIGVLVRGYADASGTDSHNLILSQRRCKSASKYLQQKGVNKACIIEKAYGETEADQSDEAQKKGKEADRKVTITFYVE